jgi:hypothetical protein
MVSSHAVYLRNRICGGKTSARSRRFSSSTPTRLADGLGPIRLPLAGWRFAPKTWVPRSRCFPRLGFRLKIWLSYFVVVVNHFERSMKFIYNQPNLKHILLTPESIGLQRMARAEHIQHSSGQNAFREHLQCGGESSHICGGLNSIP